MNPRQYKTLFIVLGALLALLVASPALQQVLVIPQTEFFTELSLLGPGHMAEKYPYNITVGENYTVFLGITNRLGSSTNYQLQVKFRNQTQSAPDSFNRTPSKMSSIYDFKVVVANNESFEIPVNFSFDYSFVSVARTVYTNVTVSGGSDQNATVEQRVDSITMPQANFHSLKFNGETLNLQGYTSDWNPQTSMFYGNLIIELWIFNDTTGGFHYHERFVDLKFNMTST